MTGEACVQLRGNTLAPARPSIRRFSSAPARQAYSASGSSQHDLASKSVFS